MAERTKKARVLVDGAYGKVNQVVELTDAQAKAGEAAGQVDSHPDAVKYAESLAPKAADDKVIE